MAQQFSLYGELSVLENLQFLAELLDVSSKDMAERTERVLTFAGLMEFKKHRAAPIKRDSSPKLTASKKSPAVWQVRL